MCNKQARTNKTLKIVVLNSVIIIVNIILFSPGLLALSISDESIWRMTGGITLLIVSIVIFIYGNYTLLTATPAEFNLNQVKTTEDNVQALKHQQQLNPIFKEDIDIILQQMARFDKKDEQESKILLQKFSHTELSYIKFQSTIDELRKIFYLNIRSSLNKINIFDQVEYDVLQKDSHIAHTKLADEKLVIYESYIAFVKEVIYKNEEILLKLDKLLLEVSKLDSFNTNEIENMTAMKEIDELINQTKYYK